MKSNRKAFYRSFLDFKKRLNVQSLNKKFDKYFKKSMILNASKIENL